MSRDALLVSFAAATALLLVCLGAVVVLCALHTQARRRLAREAAGAHQAAVWALRRYDALDAECRHFVEWRLPALMDVVARSHPGVEVPGLLHPEFAGTPVEQFFERVQGLFRGAVDLVREDVGAAARAGVRAVAEEAQTHLARCQMKVFEEFDKHPTDSPYHQGLMDFDHLVTLAVHELQRLRILAGSWAGAQRADCTLREIIESAQGRIRSYERVDYTYLPDTGEVLVEGRVVEPVTVALAELLSNATSWSPDRVAVSVLEAQTGYLLVVEDHGAGLNPFQRETAERVLSSSAVLDVTRLRHDRQLGFPVVARLAHEYGFGVDVSSPSAGGGVRAVLRVPTPLLAQPPASLRVAPGTGPASTLAALPAAGQLPPAAPAVVDEQPAPTLPAAPMPFAGGGVAGPASGSEAAPATTPGGDAATGQYTGTGVSATTGGLPKRHRRSPRPRRPISTQMRAIDTSDPAGMADRVSGVGRLIQTSLTQEGNRNDE